MTPCLQFPILNHIPPKLRKFLLTVMIISVCTVSFNCNSQSCKTIPSHFKSYEEAIATVKKLHFTVDEDVNTSRSTFIQAAHYYSCDGKTGYFIIKIKDFEYIHENMPIAVWKGFKGSSSFGTFYNLNIRNKYQMIVN